MIQVGFPVCALVYCIRCIICAINRRLSHAFPYHTITNCHLTKLMIHSDVPKLFWGNVCVWQIHIVKTKYQDFEQNTIIRFSKN